MRLSRHTLSFLLLPASILPLACGTPVHDIQGGQPASITISPATALGNSVQFTATGHYNTAPFTIAPLKANWGACQNNAPLTEVTVSSTGLATCAAGASGSVTVFADVPTDCTAITACGGGCTIRGTAQLTCP